MKTFDALGEGLRRSVKSWKGILIVWAFNFFLVMLLVFPLRSSVKAGFGRSMITEEILDGIDIEVLSDLASTMNSPVRSVVSGLFIALFIGGIMNTFLSGGLFNALKADSGKFSPQEFFRTSAKYFWPFLIITLIISIIIVFLLLLAFIVPVSLVSWSFIDSERVIFFSMIVFGAFFLLIILVLFLVTDYARAWYVLGEKPSGFQAIGFGLRRTFEKFRSSLLLMFLITAIQVLFTVMVICLTGIWKPSSGGGVFLLFIFSQILFIIKIFLRLWRYAGVTNLMEINDMVAHTVSETNS